MNTITIDCSGIDSREALHRIFAEKLAFPSWYGGNLDALFDCLTELREPTLVEFLNWEYIEITLGHYAVAARQVLADAAAENPNLAISYHCI